MFSTTRFRGRVQPESVYDIKTKCGDILISFKTFKFEFACTLCDEGCKYVSFYELFDHVTKEHNFYSEKGDPGIRLISDNGMESMEDPLSDKVSFSSPLNDYQDEEPKDEDEDLSFSETETDESPEVFSTGDETFVNKSKDIRFNRRGVLELIEMYRKCIGLWHTKTASRTSAMLKTAARRLLAQKYDITLPVNKMRLLLLRFNKTWECRKKSKSKPWFFKYLGFLRFADVDEIPDEKFDNFLCPFCASNTVNHSGSVELWNHIVEYHKNVGNLMESESNSYIMLWPTEHILQFIRIYREQESVWNNKSSEYYNRPHKVKAYQIIMDKFNKIRPNALTNRDSVVEKIRVLRMFFRRVDKKYQVDNLLEKLETTEEIENYQVYEELLFLKDVSLTQQAHFVETYTCDVCGRAFKKKSIIIEHYRMQHNDSPFKCDVCPMVFGSEETLQSHRSTHEKGDGKAYTCPICNINYFNSNDLDTHLSDHLPNRADIQICKICGATIKDRGNLLIHLRRHCDIKNYSCDICQKRFVTSSEKRLHLGMHNDGKPFICSFCGVGFKYRHHLNQHNLSHTEPRFKCTHCGLKCTTKIYLIEHEKSHAYPDVPLEKIVCELCHKLFGNTSALQRHKREVHQLRKRNVCDKIKLEKQSSKLCEIKSN